MSTLQDKIEKVIEDIGKGRIRGSTEAAEHALQTLKSIVSKSQSVDKLRDNVITFIKRTLNARPTSALLINSSREILTELKNLLLEGEDLEAVKSRMLSRVDKVITWARRSTDEAARIASKRILDGEVILTTSFSRSVIKTLEYAVDEGKKVEVIVTESRPRDDGRRTAAILSEKDIPVTLIVDSAVRYMMKDVNRVIVGAEAIAANGALINKVGTSIVALVAHEARVRVFVVAGTYKINLETVFGELVELPEAEPSTIIPPEKTAEIGPIKVKAPLYDVTPPEYVDAIVTERGIFAPQAVPLIIREIYGSWPPKVPDIKDLILELERWRF